MWIGLRSSKDDNNLVEVCQHRLLDRFVGVGTDVFAGELALARENLLDEPALLVQPSKFDVISDREAGGKRIFGAIALLDTFDAASLGVASILSKRGRAFCGDLAD